MLLFGRPTWIDFMFFNSNSFLTAKSQPEQSLKRSREHWSVSEIHQIHRSLSINKKIPDVEWTNVWSCWTRKIETNFVQAASSKRFVKIKQSILDWILKRIYWNIQTLHIQSDLEWKAPDSGVQRFGQSDYDNYIVIRKWIHIKKIWKINKNGKREREVQKEHTHV